MKYCNEDLCMVKSQLTFHYHWLSYLYPLCPLHSKQRLPDSTFSTSFIGIIPDFYTRINTPFGYKLYSIYTQLCERKMLNYATFILRKQCYKCSQSASKNCINSLILDCRCFSAFLRAVYSIKGIP